jgi:HAMP domain-containing protein
MTLHRFVFALIALALWPTVAAAQNDLERARSLYNAGQYDESIAAAMVAKNRAATAPSATLIAARGRLERFRKTGDPSDLTMARAELVSLNPWSLAPQEAIEWQIGVGSALFFEDQFGPAADMFASALPSARARLSTPELEKLLEWWAAAMSRVAEKLTGNQRKDAYATMHAAVRLELERNPLSRPATYWAVVAARGAGDIESAWNTAVAGWIRAGGQPDGQQLRGDLERFVTQTLIPERAQARTGQRLDTKATIAEIAELNEEWQALTTRWTGDATGKQDSSPGHEKP